MALGRGLSSLIPQKQPVENKPTDFSARPVSQAQNYKESVLNIEVDKIQPNPYQPRKKFDENALKDLASSIKEHGILQPITLMVSDGGKYKIIAGERRFKAARLAGLMAVPAIVKDKKGNQEQLELAILENVQREDLTPLEKSVAYKQLADEFGLTHAQIGERVGKSRSAVSNTIRLLDLPDEVKDAVEAGDISENHARAMLTLEDPAMQTKLLNEIKTQKLSARNTEVVARAMANKPIKSAMNQDPFVKDALLVLEGYLGTKVALEPAKHVSDGGSLVVKYFSNEDLKHILEKIVSTHASV